MTLKAIQAIQAGEYITYHYGTSEEDYSIGAFDCTCGLNNCVRHFRGFRYMNAEQRNRIKDRISHYLFKKYY